MMARLLFALLWLGSSVAGAQSLPELLQRERALLRQEAEALRAQRQALVQEKEELRRTMAGELDQLSQRLIELRAQADALHLQTQGAPQASLAPASFDDLIERARGTWPQELPSLPNAQSPAERWVAQVESALTHVERWRALRWEPATYFNQEGQEVQQPVLWLSQVAAWSHQGHPLALLEGHRLVALSPQHTGTRAPLRPGDTLAGAWLVDPVHPPAQLPTLSSPWQTFRSGGPVMWPILLLGLAAIAVLCERVWALLRARQSLPSTLSAVVPAIHRKEYTEAIRSAGGGVLGNVLRPLLQEQQVGHPERRRLEDLATEAILAARPSLERSLSLLNVIAMVAPLLGLLGTVTGMIETFAVITEVGTGEPRLLSAGISEALLTTQFGLTVAIPVVLLHGMLSRWVERMLGDLETAALVVLNAMEAQAASLTGDSAPPESTLPERPVLLSPISHPGA